MYTNVSGIEHFYGDSGAFEYRMDAIGQLGRHHTIANANYHDLELRLDRQQQAQRLLVNVGQRVDVPLEHGARENHHRPDDFAAIVQLEAHLRGQTTLHHSKCEPSANQRQLCMLKCHLLD